MRIMINMQNSATTTQAITQTVQKLWESVNEYHIQVTPNLATLPRPFLPLKALLDHFHDENHSFNSYVPTLQAHVTANP